MRWQRAVDAALRPLKLTHTQFLLLASAARAIRQQGDAVTQAAIAAAAGLDRATVSNLVHKLETRGLIDRDAHESDARKMRVQITQRGRKILEKATSLIGATVGDLARSRGS